MAKHAAATSLLRKPSTKARRYLYRIAMAAGPVLIMYGVLSSDEWAVWLGVAGAILDLGTNALADANVSEGEGG